MRYEEELNILHLTAEEISQAAFSRRHGGRLSVFPPRTEAESVASVTAPLTVAAAPAEVTATAEAEGETLTLRFSLEGLEKEEEETALLYCRGVGYFTGALFCRERGLAAVTLRILWEEGERTERVSAAVLERQVEKAVALFLEEDGEVIDLLVRRRPSMKKAPFPFPSPREGQRDLIRTVSGAIRHRRPALICAPTGTGKTVSTLYPAIRALGRGETDKIFYLTPKNTSALQAEETVRLFAERGVQIRGLRMTAKDTLCRARGGDGNCRHCTMSRTATGKLHAAARALFREHPVFVTAKDVLAKAETAGLCPHELLLTVSEYADVIVGDYNYLFDPKSYLRRYFDRDGAARCRATVLVDEAHNLPERARETYSVFLTRRHLEESAALCANVKALEAPSKAALAAFDQATSEMLKDEMRRDEKSEPCAFAHTAQLPPAIVKPFRHLAAALVDELPKLHRREEEWCRALEELCYEMEGITATFDRYGEGFLTWALLEGGETTLCLFAADPSALLAECAARVDSVVYFSATLSPISYYQALLAPGSTTVVEDVPSPFPVENLGIAVMDHVSTRYSERSRTLPAIVKAILEVLRAKKGNYMVFCPSFRYMEEIAALFCRVAPKIPTVIQKRNMTAREREEYLARFREDGKGYLVGFAVMGGIYAEGIDLAGDRLIGAVVVGIGIPQISPEREMIRHYYQSRTEEGTEFAYLYPGMNRVLQAAGRVIRREEDRGILVLIDDRFRDPLYRKIFPPHWHHLRYAPDTPSLAGYLSRFWNGTAPKK